MKTATVMAVVVGSLSAPAVQGEVCTASVWEGTNSGDWSDDGNWLDGVAPSTTEVAVFNPPDGETHEITIEEESNAHSIIIGSSGIVTIDIGGEVPTWLVLGEPENDNVVAPCQDSLICPKKALKLAPGFFAAPLGSGIQYDAGSDEVVGTGMYNAFNVTCAQGYESVGNASSVIVTCPFDSFYDESSFELLRCSEIIYESDWCSAGVWGIEADGDWSDESAWVYDTVPTTFVLSVVSIVACVCCDCQPHCRLWRKWRGCGLWCCETFRDHDFCYCWPPHNLSLPVLVVVV